MDSKKAYEMIKEDMHLSQVELKKNDIKKR